MTTETLPAVLGVANVRRFALGGMAELFAAERAFPEGGWARVVVKRMLPQHAKVPELVSRFRAEARLGMLLRHSNIVRVFEYAEIEGAHYMVMERIDGIDLAAVIVRCRERGVPLSQPVAAFFLNGIASALAYMADARTADGQDMGLVHRDISPSNILVSFEGTIKLIDFGVAKASEQEFRTREGFFVGKYAYMSPEQVRGEEVDIRSDLFALGNVGYELLTGKLPFLGATEFETFNQIVDSDAAPLSDLRGDVHPLLAEVIERALIKAPGGRYQHPLEMVKDLQRYFFDAVEEPPSVLATSVLEDLDLLSGSQRPRDITPSAPGAPLGSAPGAPLSSAPGAPVMTPPGSPSPGPSGSLLAVVGEDTTLDDEPDDPATAKRSRLAGLAVFGVALLLVGSCLMCGIVRWAYQALRPEPDVFVPTTTAPPVVDEGETPTPSVVVVVPRTGTINVYAEPAVEVFHNSKSLGTTPLHGMELEPGRYRFQGRCDDFDWSGWASVTVVAGESKDVRFEPRKPQESILPSKDEGS